MASRHNGKKLKVTKSTTPDNQDSKEVPKRVIHESTQKIEKDKYSRVNLEHVCLLKLSSLYVSL